VRAGCRRARGAGELGMGAGRKGETGWRRSQRERACLVVFTERSDVTY
jgi:hypothetical protein